MLELYTDYPFVRATSFAEFISPKNKFYPLTESYCLGGEIIGQESQDKDTHIWCAKVIGDNNHQIKYWREDLGEDSATILYDGTYTNNQRIRQIDLAMDQLNNPEVGITLDNGLSYIHWYNLTFWETYLLTMPDPNDTSVSLNLYYPRILLSHFKVAEAPQSDIHIFASRDGALYVANQRESYKYWNKLYDNPAKVITWRVGQCKDGRIGILFR